MQNAGFDGSDRVGGVWGSALNHHHLRGAMREQMVADNGLGNLDRPIVLQNLVLYDNSKV